VARDEDAGFFAADVLIRSLRVGLLATVFPALVLFSFELA